MGRAIGITLPPKSYLLDHCAGSQSCRSPWNQRSGTGPGQCQQVASLLLSKTLRGQDCVERPRGVGLDCKFPLARQLLSKACLLKTAAPAAPTPPATHMATVESSYVPSHGSTCTKQEATVQMLKHPVSRLVRMSTSAAVVEPPVADI